MENAVLAYSPVRGGGGARQKEESLLWVMVEGGDWVSKLQQF